MSRSKRFLEQRRADIMRLLQLHGEVRVNALAEALGVSTLTVRRDLDFLEQHQLIQRNYGVATLLKAGSGDYSSNEVQAKTAIAKAAAALVKEKETLLVNTSSTALLMLPYITVKNVTVITNNAQAVNLSLPPTLQVILTGGELRVPKEAMVGEFALRNLENVQADRAFIGCSGFSHRGGLSTSVMQEASINHAMLTRAHQVVVVADHTKLDVTSNFSYGELSEVNLLITDEHPSKAAFIEDLARSPMEVLAVAPPSMREIAAQSPPEALTKGRSPLHRRAHRARLPKHLS